MADDPTVQLSLQRPRECPTCGNTTQPEERECSLCGTILPQAELAPTSVPPELAPTVTAPPSVTPSDATVVMPPARKPAPAQADTVKIPRQEPASPPPVSQSRPASSPAVKPALTPPPRPVEPPITIPPPPLQANPLVRWGGLAVGTIALFLLSFFTAKMFLRSGTEELPPTVAKTDGGENATREFAKEPPVKDLPGAVSPPSQSASPLPPVVQSSQLVGLVTTADQLLTIRIFGAALDDAFRGSSAIRAYIQDNLTSIRNLYTTHLKTNPQSFGVVVVEFGIEPGGQVSDAVLHTTGSAGQELEQPIISQVKKWQFPATQGAVVKVFYPLIFSPEKVVPEAILPQLKDVWPGRYKVLASTAVRVYAEANASSQEVGAIGPDLLLSVVSSRDGWLGALSPKGKVGYVRQEAIFPRADNASGRDAEG